MRYFHSCLLKPSHLFLSGSALLYRATVLIITALLLPSLSVAQPLQEGRSAQAQTEVEQSEAGQAVAGSGGCLSISSVERQAKVAWYTKQRNRARTLTEQALREQKRPILAGYILSQVYEEAEGNFPKALYWAREATQWLVDACGSLPTEEEATQLHRDLLIAESYILGDMDRREEQIEALNQYSLIYQPPRDELKIWPLVKLGRFDEAREIGERLVQSEDQYVRSRSYNGMMAVECEARNRKSSYDWGMRGHIDAKEQSCVIALNMGLAARQCFKFEEEERFNRVALRGEDQDCSSSPYIQSSATYLIRGEFQKSISALSSWAPSTPMEWTQSHMRVKARRAELMYGLGVWHRGLKEIHEVASFPDRAAGIDSASAEMLNLESYVLYWGLLEGQRIADQERRAVRGYWAWVKDQPQRVSHAWNQWKVKRKLLLYAAYHQNLIDLVRPYFSSVMPWYSSLLPHVIGGGILRATLTKARELETDYPEIAGAYLEGMEAELFWVEGDHEQALSLAESAIQKIPKEAKLFIYRLRALKWAAKMKLAEAPQLDDDLHVLLSEYPVVLRSLNLSIPVEITHSGGEIAAEAAERFAQSPRFTLAEGQNALSLQVEQTADRLEVCLAGLRGNRYRCAETLIDLEAELEQLRQKRSRSRGSAIDVEHARATGKTDGEPTNQQEEQAKDSPRLDLNPALRLIDRAHQELFSPQVELTQREMDTLDGNIRQLKAEDALDALD